MVPFQGLPQVASGTTGRKGSWQNSKSLLTEFILIFFQNRIFFLDFPFNHLRTNMARHGWEQFLSQLVCNSSKTLPCLCDRVAQRAPLPSRPMLWLSPLLGLLTYVVYSWDLLFSQINLLFMRWIQFILQPRLPGHLRSQSLMALVAFRVPGQHLPPCWGQLRLGSSHLLLLMSWGHYE